MKRTLYSTKSVSYEHGAEAPFSLEYYILEDDIDFKSKKRIYGIEIIKTEEQNGIKLKEKKSIEGISSSENIIFGIIKMLDSNLVTPITLKDVIEDMIEVPEVRIIAV